MTTYYFDGEIGSNGNAGTSPAAPKKDASGVVFAGGDVCLLNRGKVWVAPAGTQAINLPANGIRVGAYGIGERPVINCGNVSRGVNVGTNIADWVIEDLQITNVASGTSRRGITNATTGSSETVAVNGTIRRVRIDNVLSDLANDCNGIALFGDRVRVLDCEISDIATDGIWARVRNLEIGRTRVVRVAQDEAAGRVGEFGDCVQFGGAGASDFSGGWVHDCEFDHSDVESAKNGLIVNGASATKAMTFQRNKLKGPVFANHTTLYLDAPGIVCCDNEIEGGDYGIYAVSASGAQIYNNRVRGANFGIRAASSAAGLKIWNNTIAKCGTGGYATAADATTDFRNNIFLSCATGLLRHIANAEDYNCFFGNGANASYTGGSSSIGVHSVLADPQLDAELRPVAGSPVIAAGVWVGILRDGAGRAARNPPSIGAFEQRVVRGVYSGTRKVGA